MQQAYNTQLILSIVVFLATLLLVLKNPKKIGIGWWAMAGAFVCFLLGITTFEDVVVVWGIVGNATLTFVSIIIITLLFDEAGYFEYIAAKIARFSKGNLFRVFILFLLFDAVIGALFANDGAALVLTPIAISFIRAIGMDSKSSLALIMSVGFVADSSSLPLVTSNLVNIVSATYFSMTYLDYFIHMIIPDLVSVGSSILILTLIYRKSIKRSYSVESASDPGQTIRDWVIFRLATPYIVLMIAAYFLTSIFRIEVAFVAVPAMILLVGIYYLRNKSTVIKAAKGAPWQVVIFSFGMYLIVFGMSSAGLLQIIATVVSHLASLQYPLNLIMPGYFFSLMAAFMNNMPSVMIGSIAIAHLSGGSHLIYSNVIGNDIGPKFTPIGSLATLLWLHTIRSKGGLAIGASYYMKIGFIVALPVLTLTLFSLYI